MDARSIALVRLLRSDELYVILRRPNRLALAIEVLQTADRHLHCCPGYLFSAPRTTAQLFQHGSTAR